MPQPGTQTKTAARVAALVVLLLLPAPALAGKAREVALGGVVGVCAGAAAGGLFYLTTEDDENLLPPYLGAGAGVGLLVGMAWGALREGEPSPGEVEIGPDGPRLGMPFLAVRTEITLTGPRPIFTAHLLNLTF